MRLKDYDGPDLIGGSEGVSREIWQLQLQAAVGSQGPVFIYGVEVSTKPAFRHCSAEGI